jgi:hypothetical protein
MEISECDFGFKINKFVCNLAHIFILRRALIILLKNIVYLEGILHFRRWKPWKLGMNHPTIGISQKVPTHYPFSAIYCNALNFINIHQLTRANQSRLHFMRTRLARDHGISQPRTLCSCI